MKTSNLINFILKLIPAKIIISSLYWLQINDEMDKELIIIFSLIDNDKYDEAEKLEKEFHEKWDGKYIFPEWVAETYSKIYKAGSMINFMKA